MPGPALSLLRGYTGYQQGKLQRRQLEAQDQWKMLAYRQEQEDRARAQAVQDVQMQATRAELAHALEMAPFEVGEARTKAESQFVPEKVLADSGFPARPGQKILWSVWATWMERETARKHAEGAAAFTPEDYAKAKIQAITSGTWVEPERPGYTYVPEPGPAGSLLGEPLSIAPRYPEDTTEVAIPGYPSMHLRAKPTQTMNQQATALQGLGAGVAAGWLDPEYARTLVPIVAPDLVGAGPAVPQAQQGMPRDWSEAFTGGAPTIPGAPPGTPKTLPLFRGPAEKPLNPTQRASLAATMRRDIRDAYQAGATDFDTYAARQGLWDLEHPDKAGQIPPGWGRVPAIKPSQQETLDIQNLRASIAQQNANTSAARAAASASRSQADQAKVSTLMLQDDRLRDDQNALLKELDAPPTKDVFGRLVPIPGTRRQEIVNSLAELTSARDNIYHQMVARGVPSVKPRQPLALQERPSRPVRRFKTSGPRKEIASLVGRGLSRQEILMEIARKHPGWNQETTFGEVDRQLAALQGSH